MKRGTLIVLEGSDASGKETQAKMLCARLEKEYKDIKLISFPDYESEASYPVRLYLEGKLGTDVSSLNAYSAATFFAVDRLISYLTKWKKFYEQGFLIIADRYIPSNMVHQAVKIKDLEERETFFAWLLDLELHKFCLPVPDIVFFLDMEVEASLLLRQKRHQEEGISLDIHEQDEAYLKKCYKQYQTLCIKNDWIHISCSKDKIPLAKEEIHRQIYTKLQAYFQKKAPTL